MKWFCYVWIGMLIIAYLIWTIKCIVDFVRDVRGCWKLLFLFYLFQAGASWAYWIVIHACVLFIGSLIAFIVYGGWLL